MLHFDLLYLIMFSNVAASYYKKRYINEIIPLENPINMSIETETHLKKLQYTAYATYLGLSWCLSSNAFAVTALLDAGGVDPEIVFLAMAYLVIGGVALCLLWYRPLRLALWTQNVSMYRQFFVFFGLHIALCIFAAVSPPVIYKGRSLTGILSAVDVYSDYGYSVGFEYFKGFGLFSLESLLSLWVLQQVYKYYHCSSLPLEIV